jgi:hypothetical protein
VCELPASRCAARACNAVNSCGWVPVLARDMHLVWWRACASPCRCPCPNVPARVSSDEDAVVTPIESVDTNVVALPREGSTSPRFFSTSNVSLRLEVVDTTTGEATPVHPDSDATVIIRLDSVAGFEVGCCLGCTGPRAHAPRSSHLKTSTRTTPPKRSHTFPPPQSAPTTPSQA